MTIGSPLVATGAPVPETPVENPVDQTDIPTYRSDYRFSGYRLPMDEVGITVAYRHQTQPRDWSRRATYVYTPKLVSK